MKIGNIFKGDKGIWMVFFFLCVISVVEVFSASSGLTYKSNNFITPIFKHSGMLVFGVFVTVVTTNIPCRYFKLMTPFLLIFSFVTLLWVLFSGEAINGAQRVIEIPGFTFQPSEIAKGTMILAEAQILSAMQLDNGTDKKAFKYIMWLAVPMAFLIMLENLSTAALLCLVVLLMMFVGRVPMIQIGKLMGAVTLMVVLALSFVMLAGDAEKAGNNKKTSKTETLAAPPTADSGKTATTLTADGKTIDAAGKNKDDKEGTLSKMFHRADTWKARILDFNSEEVPPRDYDLDKGAQVAHANIAIVSSNFIGKGPGNSVERDFLAQAFSDFIYAIIIEELGIVGAAFVVFLYIILLFRTARIANRCENYFPALLAMGLALLLVVQATFNMLVAVGFVPVTGQPLPLISKGGTSTIINCAYIGAILSVSRTAKRKQNIADEDKTDTLLSGSMD